MNNTPHKISEYKGQRFGRLEARADDPNNSKVGTHWWFLCDCGNYVSRRATSVLKGRTQSCGCKRGDWLKAMRKDMREVSELREEARKAFLAGCDYGTDYYNEGCLGTPEREIGYQQWRAGQ